MTALVGADVSKYQLVSDWTGQDIAYLIARAGIGTLPDPRYDAHVAASRKRGILTGSYWYGIGNIDGLTVAEQVDAYIATEGDVDLHALDWEGADGFSASQCVDFMNAYRRKTGNRIGLYASESRFRDLGQDWNWIANYSAKPTKRFDIWQYGPLVPGVDGDRFYGSLDELKALTGGADMNYAAVTDETPRLTDVIVGDALYELDGVTKIASSTVATAGRPTPYGTASKRAIYATIGGVRRPVLVAPRNLRDVPAPVDAYTAETQAAAVATAVEPLSAQIADLGTQITSLQGQVADLTPRAVIGEAAVALVKAAAAG